MGDNPITYTFKWIFGKEGHKEEKMYSPLVQELNEDNINLRKESASLKAQIGKFTAKNREEEEEEKQRDKEQERVVDMNEQQRKISQERIGDTISLGKIFFKFFKLDWNGKVVPKYKIELTDKDGSEVFSNMGDILISTKTGYLILTDSNGNPMAMSPRLDGLIYKPEGLGNQIKVGRILLPRDRDFNPVVDLENLEVNDVSYDTERQEWQETEEYKKKVRELMVEKESEIREQNLKIERLEFAQIKQRKLLESYERTLRLYNNKEQVTQAELSKALSTDLQFINKMGDLSKQIANLSHQKALSEEMKDTTEAINKQILDKHQKIADRTTYELAKDETKGDLEWAKGILPENVSVEVPKEPQEVRLPNPGEVIGQRRDVKPQ